MEEYREEEVRRRLVPFSSVVIDTRKLGETQGVGKGNVLVIKPMLVAEVTNPGMVVSTRRVDEVMKQADIGSKLG